METLLISPERLKDTSRIENNVSDRLLKDIIINVQDTVLQPIIGTSLYNRLINNVETLNSDETSLIKDYIWNVLTYAVLYELMSTGTYKISSTGVVKSGSQDFTVADISEIAKIKRQIKYDLGHYVKYLSEYLVFNSAKFPKYNANINVGEHPHQPASFGSIYISKKSLGKKNNTSIF